MNMRFAAVLSFIWNTAQNSSTVKIS